MDGFNIGTGTIGNKIYSLIELLYPICRSITGPGVRETLNILGAYIPIEKKQISTGTKVFDWEIPKEWSVDDAYLIDPDGRKILDFSDSNLHLLNYSIPFEGIVSLKELEPHLFTIPEQPDLIPYRTSYYNENWGFCMTHNQFLSLKEGDYKVVINTKLEPGYLDWGELYIPGEREEEFVFTTHICHPSLCNDNLSGISILTLLAKSLLDKSLKYSYRFLFIPGTIGSITCLSQNENRLGKIKYGLVITLLGDTNGFTYKKSRNDNTPINNIVQAILEEQTEQYEIRNFIPFGYDERQFCSPGIDLPFGCLMRSSFGEYPEYHTSGDNLKFINKISLEKSFNLIQNIIEHAESEAKFINLYPKCEPQLGKRGIYKAICGSGKDREKELALLWILNYSDGNNSLQDISRKSHIEIGKLVESASILKSAGLIAEC